MKNKKLSRSARKRLFFSLYSPRHASREAEIHASGDLHTLVRISGEAEGTWHGIRDACGGSVFVDSPDFFGNFYGDSTTGRRYLDAYDYALTETRRKIR